MATIQVELGNRSYDIRIELGLIETMAEELASHHLHGPAYLLTSPRIWRLHGAGVLTRLERKGYRAQCIRIPEGEHSKCLDSVSRLISRLLREGADRSSLILAFGGGMIGDLAGFVAAIYLRGIRLVQIPTTLLGQIDSSIGGKVGINHPRGKNLVGAFHQPSLVLSDPSALRTLPVPEWRAGLFEAIKYGIIADSRLFSFIESNIQRLLLRDMSVVPRLLESCVRIKSRVVSRDEREANLRMILNLGHTVGHALEVVTQYRLLRHGDAVGWGMLFAMHHALRLGLIKGELTERVGDLVAAVGLPELPSLRLDGILGAMRQDKKRSGDTFKLVLPVRIGEVVIQDTNDRRAIADSLKECGILH